jgi:hypothetical protein
METNIWALTLDQIKALHFGTRVIAGASGERGTFLSVKKCGTVIVAWDCANPLKDAKTMARLVEYALT